MGNISSHKSSKYANIDEPPVISEPDVQQLRSPSETDDNGVKADANEENNVGTPVLLKNRHHIMALIDPRSPTQEISRTPIAVDEQLQGGPRMNPRLATLKENSTPRTGNTSVGGFFDPRSPSQEIDRTPIRYAKREGVSTTKIAF